MTRGNPILRLQNQSRWHLVLVSSDARVRRAGRRAAARRGGGRGRRERAQRLRAAATRAARRARPRRPGVGSSGQRRSRKATVGKSKTDETRTLCPNSHKVERKVKTVNTRALHPKVGVGAARSRRRARRAAAAARSSPRYSNGSEKETGSDGSDAEICDGRKARKNWSESGGNGRKRSRNWRKARRKTAGVPDAGQLFDRFRPVGTRPFLHRFRPAEVRAKR
eukprot:gene12731-biopygen47